MMIKNYKFIENDISRNEIRISFSMNGHEMEMEFFATNFGMSYMWVYDYTEDKCLYDYNLDTLNYIFVKYKK